MDAFSKMPNEHLVIVGSYEKSKHFVRHKKYLESIKPTNVEILHWVSERELRNLYATCKGFIATAIDEDFGLTLVEAMASGKPIIAANEGGYKETVIAGETGILIDDISVDTLISAIEEISKAPDIFSKACIKRARKFDTENFVTKIKKLIEYAK